MMRHQHLIHTCAGLFCASMAYAQPVPMISDVLSCGRVGTAGGLADGTEMQRANLDVSSFPDALCNDGTGAVFYFRPYVEPANRNKWVIQLQGGGGCSSGETCANRWCMRDTNFSMLQMTSDVAPAIAINGKGITDRRPLNPIGNWNHVLIRYCSSDLWRGTTRDVVLETDIEGPLVSYRIHFLGYRIIDAVLATLRGDGVPLPVYDHTGASFTLPDLDDATSILFAGASAGGGGVIQNADRVATYLRTHNNACSPGGGCPLEFRALIDSTFSPDLERLDFANAAECAMYGACDWQSIVAFATQAFQPRVDESCHAWHQANAPGTEWQCVDNGHVIRHHVTSPVFIQMGQTDALISSNYYSSGFEVPGVGVIELPVFSQLVRDQLAEMENIQATAKQGASIQVIPGVFSTTCSNHETLRDNAHIFNAFINTGATNVTFFDVMLNWLSGTDPDIVITQPGQVDFCPGFRATDCDFNGAVDLVDFEGLSACFAGPGVPSPAACVCFDPDESHTVDLRDFSSHQRIFGP